MAPEFASPALVFFDVDLCDAAATRAVVAEVAARFAVTRLVHNAGAIRAALVDDARVEDLAALAQLHLGAPLLLLQAVLPAMRAGRFGRVVLIGSRAALGLATRTAYAATKAGMVGMARTWALELAGDGITVNVVAPGPIRGTAMFHDVVPAGSLRWRRECRWGGWERRRTWRGSCCFLLIGTAGL
jgi:NAD(P)-dependent dehydrogenase (short-subunit alcohol dehydrogenase family)